MNKEIYGKYLEKLPEKLIQYKENPSFGNGLINLCNPEKYESLINDGYSKKNAIVFATTAFGDLLVWENDKYVNLISFSEHKVSVLESGFDFFFEDIIDEVFLNKYFDLSIYNEAVNNLGKCLEDECFISSPVPGISGARTAASLSKGKLLEYNILSIDMLGSL